MGSTSYIGKNNNSDLDI
ncbi:MAG: hypothetical protein KFE23_00890 [Candidatus Baumannia cicadellinicola]|nr:hypothetical protein [Candidatus Baumannia cicadellinicola]